MPNWEQDRKRKEGTSLKGVSAHTEGKHGGLE